MCFSPPAVTTRLQPFACSACQDTVAGVCVWGGLSRCTPEPRSSGRAPQPQPFPVPTLTGLLPGTQRSPNISSPGLRSADSTFKGMEEFPCGTLEGTERPLCTLHNTISSPSHLLSRRDSGGRYQKQSACSGCWYPCWDASALSSIADRVSMVSTSTRKSKACCFPSLLADKPGKGLSALLFSYKGRYLCVPCTISFVDAQFSRTPHVNEKVCRCLFLLAWLRMQPGISAPSWSHRREDEVEPIHPLA